MQLVAVALQCFFHLLLLHGSKTLAGLHCILFTLKPQLPMLAGSSQQQPETLLLLHGNPTWSFLYHHVIPLLTGAGFRVLALDFAGFGRSDKLPEVRHSKIMFRLLLGQGSGFWRSPLQGLGAATKCWR
jgi:pimeloyl-ACP methyl ester carboxylesterase